MASLIFSPRLHRLHQVLMLSFRSVFNCDFVLSSLSLRLSPEVPSLRENGVFAPPLLGGCSGVAGITTTSLASGTMRRCKGLHTHTHTHSKFASAE